MGKVIDMEAARRRLRPGTVGLGPWCSPTPVQIWPSPEMLDNPGWRPSNPHPPKP